MIYTVGYSGRKLNEIKEIAQRLDATIFDIRFNPTSRNPQFRQRYMATELGDRYLHVKALGNINYKGGPIEILDFLTGLEMIANHWRRHIVLLCVCKDAATCHRTVVAGRLKEMGYLVEEIGEIQPEPEAKQLNLFE